jgi:hypothetical protein
VPAKYIVAEMNKTRARDMAGSIKGAVTLGLECARLWVNATTVQSLICMPALLCQINWLQPQTLRAVTLCKVPHELSSVSLIGRTISPLFSNHR